MARSGSGSWTARGRVVAIMAYRLAMKPLRSGFDPESCSCFTVCADEAVLVEVVAVEVEVAVETAESSRERLLGCPRVCLSFCTSLAAPFLLAFTPFLDTGPARALRLSWIFAIWSLELAEWTNRVTSLTVAKMRVRRKRTEREARRASWKESGDRIRCGKKDR